MKLRIFLLMLVSLYLFRSVASAEVLLTCYEPKGSMYVVGDGWVEDGFTNGKFQLVSDGDEFDIFVTDAAGTRSSKADGAAIVVTEESVRLSVYE
jgi:hypothetical protein